MSTIAPRRGIRAPYVLIVPAVVILLAGMGYPLIWQFVTSMQEYGLAQQFGKPAPFVGFDNFVTLATDPVLWTVVARSLAFCVLTAAVTLAVGTLLALLMTVVTKTARLSLQIALLLAWSMPVVAAMTVWIWLFDRRRGVVNYLLDMIPGVEMNRFDWLSTPLTFFAVASIIVIWMSVPFVAFSIYAGLTQVSDEVLEAAALDGANGIQRFRLIVVPYIRSILIVLLILQIIWDLRVFAQIYALQTIGGVRAETNTIGVYIYSVSMASGDLGAGGAIAVILVAIMLAISAYYIRTMLKEDDR